MSRENGQTCRRGAGFRGNLAFEAKLLLVARKLRNIMDGVGYKHVVLERPFLKYVLDSIEERRVKLVTANGGYADTNPGDKDDYTMENVFCVFQESRRPHLWARAKQRGFGKVVDEAIIAIEPKNLGLNGGLKIYDLVECDKNRLGELIDRIGTIRSGNRESRYMENGELAHHVKVHPRRRIESL
jgi:type I restriction enzyme M protein